jgi:hypothetical protein
VRRARSLLYQVMVAGTVLFAGAAQARDSYDCADHVGISAQERWSPSEAQFRQAIGDFYRSFPSQEHFSIRMCGVTENGAQVMIVGALHMVADKKICDDDLNFAVLYDPNTRKFGDAVPHQTFCAGPDPVHRTP